MKCAASPGGTEDILCRPDGATNRFATPLPNRAVTMEIAGKTEDRCTSVKPGHFAAEVTGIL